MAASEETEFSVKDYWNKVFVRSIERKQCQIVVGDTLAFIGDEPPALKGDGYGPNPFALVLAGLGL